MKATDLIKIASHESIMTLIFVKKDGTYRKVLASRCTMMYDKVAKDNDITYKHKGTPAGCFSFVDVTENKWKRLIVSNLIAVIRPDGTTFCTNKRTLKKAERLIAEAAAIKASTDAADAEAEAKGEVDSRDI